METEKIGKLIAELRHKNNLTQAELANILNVTSQAVSKWENNRGIPDVEMLKKLSEIFNTNIDDLLNGDIKPKKNKSIFPIFLILISIILVCLSIFLLTKKEAFTFKTLASDNNAFSIKGVIAYDRNKKSIYISDVKYDGKDEEEYKSIECILYETNKNSENKISVWGELDKNNSHTYPLTELLKGLEFNVDDYNCSCENPTCNNLFLRINALNKDNKTITYNIPLQIDNKCNIK